MPEEASAFEIIYSSLLLLGGLACFVHFIFFFRQPKQIRPEQALSPWRIGVFPFLIGSSALIVVVALILSFVGTLAPPAWIQEETPHQILLFGFAMHLTALLVLFVLYRSYPEKFSEPFVRRKQNWGRSFLIAVYSFMVLVPVIFPLTFGWSLLLELIGIEPKAQDAVQIFAQLDNLPILLSMVFLTVVVAPVSEEFLFRGCLYRFIKGRSTILLALIVTNLLFAALHQNLLSLLPLFLLGTALAYVYEKSGDLKVPILLHGIFNLNTVIVIVVTNNLL
jgi:membrane protease YdiL (CAAX protease family)